MAGVVAGIVAAPGEAKASGYLTARFGSDHGTPVMPNGYAIYYNPAALGGATGTTLTGDVAIALRWADYKRGADALSPSDPNLRNDPAYVGSNTGKANLLNLLALPFVGVNTDFGGSRYFRGGWAVYVPFGGMATWDRNDSAIFNTPGTVDRVQRWHNISGQLLSIYNTFAFAVKPHPRFSVGLSLSPIIHTVGTVRARNPDGSDDTVVNGSLVEGRSLIHATGFNVGGALGVYWEPTDQLRLGLSYTTQPGLLSGNTTTTMSGELKAQLGNGNPSTTDVDFHQSLPDVIRFGVAYRTSDRLELRSDFEFVRWSVFDRQCITKKDAPCEAFDDGRVPSTSGVILNVPRKWNNAIGVRVGPSYSLTDSVELFGSLGLTTPAVPVRTIDASTIDALRFYGAIGARFAVSKKVAFATSYNHIYFATVDTEGRNQQHLPQHPLGSPDAGDYNASRSPNADGRYRSQIGIVDINVSYTF